MIQMYRGSAFSLFLSLTIRVEKCDQFRTELNGTKELMLLVKSGRNHTETQNEINCKQKMSDSFSLNTRETFSLEEIRIIGLMGTINSSRSTPLLFRILFVSVWLNAWGYKIAGKFRDCMVQRFFCISPNWPRVNSSTPKKLF